jgi:tetratricopeptide (TPR) repeat protein
LAAEVLVIASFEDPRNRLRWVSRGFLKSGSRAVELSALKVFVCPRLQRIILFGMSKFAVNAPCPCGSGKKFKKCCGSPRQQNDRRPSEAGGSWKPADTSTAKIRQPVTTKWQKNPVLSCPCGSKKAYGSCCRPIIASGTPLTKEALKRFDAGDFVRAEVLYRAHFVQYLEWVHAHTLPFLRSKKPVINQLVEIDVEALVELADVISYCLNRLNRAADIIPFLDHVESVVPLPSFDKDMAYLRATWLYVALDDQEAARRQLLKIGDILAYHRRNALELYLDIFGQDLPERQKIAIAENIISQADKDDHIKVQYTALMAVALVLIGEQRQALAKLETMLTVISPPVQIETFRELSVLWQLAKAWSLYGAFNKDGAALMKGEELLLRIPKEMLTSLGQASLLQDLGWVLRDQARFRDAAIAFKHSLALNTSTVTKIHLAHSLALCGETDEAQIRLRNIGAAELEAGLQLEFFAAKGSLAIATANTTLAMETVSGLRGTLCKAPFWTVQRDQLIIEMLDFIHQPESHPPAVRQQAITRLLRSVNEVFELKPKFFGIGVDVNKLIEKLARRLEKN